MHSLAFYCKIHIRNVHFFNGKIWWWKIPFWIFFCIIQPSKEPFGKYRMQIWSFAWLNSTLKRRNLTSKVSISHKCIQMEVVNGNILESKVSVSSSSNHLTTIITRIERVMDEIKYNYFHSFSSLSIRNRFIYADKIWSRFWNGILFVSNLSECSKSHAIIKKECNFWPQHLVSNLDASRTKRQVLTEECCKLIAYNFGNIAAIDRKLLSQFHHIWMRL